jgi:hypothetical protein
MKHPLVLLAIVVVGFEISCKLDSNPCEAKTVLPDPTNIGANTMGCLINGDVWVAQVCPGSVLTDVHADWGLPDGGLTLSGRKHMPPENESLLLTMSVDSIFGTGVYDLASSYFGNHINLCQYYADSTWTNGTMTITEFDRTNYIIAGTFECVLYSNDCDDTLIITDGRFDVRE